VGRFFADRVFGPGRAELLAAQIPATDADAAADRDARAARLQARIRRIETAQNSQILELEQLPADPADTASAAMRARIRARFADLHHEREQLETQLAALAKTTPAAAEPALLDELPLLGDLLPGLPRPSKPACSPRSAWKSCGTSPVSKSPCSWRSPRTPSRPSPASPTPARTATTTPITPAPTLTSPNSCGIWATPLD